MGQGISEKISSFKILNRIYSSGVKKAFDSRAFAKDVAPVSPI